MPPEAHTPMPPRPPERHEELGYTPDAIAFLGVSRLHGVGFQSMVRLGGRDGVKRTLETKDVGAFESALAAVGSRFSAQAEELASWEDLRRRVWSLGLEAARKLADLGVRLVFAGDYDFPRSFRAMSPEVRPGWIFVRGDLGLLDRPAVTIVGTREASEVGEFLTRYAVACAREIDAPVVSGLAKGIDRIAHEWCLKLALPTVSVMGTGILTTYPAKHAGLGEEIVRAGGALISEYLPDQGPSAENFVWRNRLQAALGRMLIPTEWGRKSGTAHTVRFARTYGRPVLGLLLAGAAEKPDAGEPDQQYDIPREHGALTAAMRDALATPLPGGEPEDSGRQMDLFGGGR